MRPPARHPRNRDAAVRRKRKARHALSGKPVPKPLPRSAVVEEAPGHKGKWRARPNSQGRDLTHEKSRRDPHLARAEPDEAVRTGRNITRIALVFEAGRDGFWLDLWRLILFRKIPEYPVSGTDGSNPSSSSGESANHRFLSGGARSPQRARRAGAAPRDPETVWKSRCVAVEQQGVIADHCKPPRLRARPRLRPSRQHMLTLIKCVLLDGSGSLQCVDTAPQKLILRRLWLATMWQR